MRLWRNINQPKAISMNIGDNGKHLHNNEPDSDLQRLLAQNTDDSGRSC